MKAGRLDRLITLQRKSVTQNDTGEEVVSWVDVTTVWAEKRETGGTERFAAEQFIGKENCTFRIRWSDTVKEITSEHQVVFDGRAFEIVSGPREIGRREGIEIDCTVRTETQIDNA